MRNYRKRRPPPANAPLLIKFIFFEMDAQRIGEFDMADKSGVHRATQGGWRRTHAVSLPNAEAVLNVLGLTCQIPTPVEWLSRVPTARELLEWRERLEVMSREMEKVYG